MEIVDNTEVKLLVPDYMVSHIQSNIEKSEIINNKGKLVEVLVYWGLQEMTRLNQLISFRKPLPSPMSRDYDWPGSYQPFEHQKTTEEFLSINNRAFCFNEAGTGKTSSALWAMDYLMKQNEIKRRGPDLKLTINKIGNRPSGKVDESVPLIQKTISATQYMCIEPRLTIGSTDSKIPISLGLPAVTIGRGGEGGGAHSLDEWWLNKDGFRAIQLALLILLSESGIN